jgi:hypothetical protein
MFDSIVAAGQQRLRPIISTTLSTIGGILILTITDKLWEGLGVVLIFGLGFATVLTLVVVPIMYTLFEGLGYYIISAFRGPRWKEVPQGRSFFFSRRRHARLGLILVLCVQLLVLAAGFIQLAPGFTDVIRDTAFQAPSALKLLIEVSVFFIGLALKAMGILLFLMIPTWIGLVFFMAKRSREGYYVDVTSEGITVGSPVDRFFLQKSDITKIRKARFFPFIPSIHVYAGKHRIIIRKLIEATRVPDKKPLPVWFKEPAPKKSEIRESMMNLKRSLEEFLNK